MDQKDLELQRVLTHVACKHTIVLTNRYKQRQRTESEKGFDRALCQRWAQHCPRFGAFLIHHDHTRHC